jgi:hypothetical protein
MEFDVSLQTLTSHRTGFEGKDPNAAAFAMKENRGQPNIGAHVEYALPVVKLDAVLQVTTRFEHFAVDKPRFIGI